MPDLPDRRAHRLQPQRQRLEQLRRGEHAADVVVGLQDRDRLVDHVVLVGLQVLAPALLDQLDHPARVEVDAEGDAAAVLGQVLHRQAQAPRARRAQHQPVRAAREVLVGQRLAEDLVVGAEVLTRDAGLRDAGGAAGLEHEDRLPGEALRHPALHRAAAQPLVLERTQPGQIGEPVDLAPRIPSELARVIEPERTAGGGVEVPGHDFADPCVQARARGVEVGLG